LRLPTVENRLGLRSISRDDSHWYCQKSHWLAHFLEVVVCGHLSKDFVTLTRLPNSLWVQRIAFELIDRRSIDPRLSFPKILVWNHFHLESELPVHLEPCCGFWGFGVAMGICLSFPIPRTPSKCLRRIRKSYFEAILQIEPALVGFSSGRKKMVFTVLESCSDGFSQAARISWFSYQLPFLLRRTFSALFGDSKRFLSDSPSSHANVRTMGFDVPTKPQADF
jgi:hypothetical protein